MIIGAILGLVSSIAPRVLDMGDKFMQTKQDAKDKAHEYKMAQLAATAQAEASERAADHALTQSRVKADAQASVARYDNAGKELQSASQWARNIISMVRPYLALTTGTLYLVICVWGFITHMINTGDIVKAWQFLLMLQFAEFVGYVFVFYFSNRSQEKHKLAKR